VQLHRFASGEGAEAFGRYLISQAGDRTVPFAVDGVRGARGLRSPELDDDSYHAVVLGRGRYVAVVLVAGPGGSDPALVSEVARKQFDLLG
jgi:hypothetical protein